MSALRSLSAEVFEGGPTKFDEFEVRLRWGAVVWIERIGKQYNDNVRTNGVFLLWNGGIMQLQGVQLQQFLAVLRKFPSSCAPRSLGVATPPLEPTHEPKCSEP